MSAETSGVFLANMEELSAGRHDSHLLLRHPYLNEFDDLRGVAKAIEKVVEREQEKRPEKGASSKKKLGDPTNNDYRLLLNLADIVSNEDGFAHKGFKVEV